MSKILKFAAGGIAASLPAGAALADWAVNMPVGVTELSREIHSLHMLIFWICVMIAMLVFGAMIYSIVKFRHSKGAVPASFDHSTRVEVVWTIVPIAILVGMAIPAAETLIKIEDTRNADLTVKVTGYQWKWHYEYMNLDGDQQVAFFSTLARKSDHARQLDSGVDVTRIDNYLLEVDRPLVVPQGAKVRVLLTAADVIHAWWVPKFGMKKDAIPGFVNELWFRADDVGIYRGQCTELCGQDHAFMPVVVDVRTPKDYASWLAEQKGGEQQQGEQPAAAATPVAQSADPSSENAVAGTVAGAR